MQFAFRAKLEKLPYLCPLPFALCPQFALCTLYESIKPHRQLVPHDLRGGVSDAVEEVELDVAAGAADGIGVTDRDHIVDRLVSRAVPDLDRAGRDDDLFTVGIGEGADLVRVESDRVLLAPFLGRETVSDHDPVAR